MGRSWRGPWISVALVDRGWSVSAITTISRLGTFLINISGSFLIGYLSVLFNVDWHNRHGHGMVLNALVITGVLGGYTTFSSMQLDAARLAAKQHARLAAFYLFLSVAAGLLAALAGAALARAQG